ncbi:MAG: enoyl-CoA hydratase/isomerase family protein [Proteobacteria bacterium]|nr:enoyl-CoA hydratase/isomerase family protein [Pseudomonadota bacterium]
MINMRLDDGVAIVTLEHGKANALDLEFCEALAVLFGELRGNADIKAVVLTGQDNGKAKMFSAGVDLKRLSAGGADYVREFLPRLHQLYDAVFFCPKPVVAAVNGHAIAGGAVLAACADRRVMARYSGRVGITELQVGVPLPALAFEIVRTVVPPNYLAEFALGAGTYASDDALIKGWIDEVVDGWELMPRAIRLARTYAALSPEAFAQTKAQIRQPASERLALSGAATDEKVIAIWTQEATLARIADYVAKTLKRA